MFSYMKNKAVASAADPSSWQADLLESWRPYDILCLVTMLSIL